MNFLAASFLIGTLAVAAPIYIHMIRKTPANKFSFSSLRFLTPSPETQASRSSIEHWLLLCLRVLIIILLCLAFATLTNVFHIFLLATLYSQISMGLLPYLALNTRGSILKSFLLFSTLIYQFLDISICLISYNLTF